MMTLCLFGFLVHPVTVIRFLSIGPPMPYPFLLRHDPSTDASKNYWTRYYVFLATVRPTEVMPRDTSGELVLYPIVIPYMTY